MKQHLLLVLFFLFGSNAFAQTGQWTWMSGDSTRNAKTVYTSKGTPSATGTPGGRSQTTSWSDASGNLWLFGGYRSPDGSNFAMTNDLWKYTPATGQWTWMSGDSLTYQGGSYNTKGVPAGANKPGARIDAAGWTDQSGNLWLFGGYGYAASGGPFLNDLWRYTPATNLWTWMAGDSIFNQPGVYGTKGVPAAANKPGARIETSFSMDAAGNFWMFGGRGYATSPSATGYLSDVWKYTPATGQWTWAGGNLGLNVPGNFGTQGISSPANTPGSRYRAVSWSDLSGNFWVFGGVGYGGTGSDIESNLNDLWKFTPATAQWTWVRGERGLDAPGIYGTRGVAADANQPGARQRPAGRSDASGNFWLYGGLGRNSAAVTNIVWNDLWKYEPATNRWTWVSGDNVPDQPGVYGTKGKAAPANKPASRSSTAMWLDPAGTIWLYGGYAYPGATNDMWGDLWKYPIGTPGTLGSAGGLTASKEQQAVVLNWTTTNQQSASYFVVERYSQNTSYDSIGVVTALTAISLPHTYSFTDRAPLQGTNFYRIRQQARNGALLYSATAQVSTERINTAIAVIGNPVQSVLRISLLLPSAQKVSWQVRDLNGQVMIRSQEGANQGSSIRSIAVDRLARGTYLIEVETDGFRSTKVFVKQ